MNDLTAMLEDTDADVDTSVWYFQEGIHLSLCMFKSFLSFSHAMLFVLKPSLVASTFSKLSFEPNWNGVSESWEKSSKQVPGGGSS